MAKSVFKHYDFQCDECSAKFNKGMWITADGAQEGVTCPECEKQLFHTPDTDGTPFMVNRREKWKKKIPGEYKEWMETTFAKRHGTEQTINMRDD